MLRHLYRNLRFTAHTLKRYTYSRPEEIEWLRNKFYSNPKFVDKLEYLSKLEKENGLENFFGNKPEIYYLFNSDMDYKIDEKGKIELMAKINSTYFKCIIAKEFRWINDVEQCLIVINFNQQIYEMASSEITFCLEIISEFHNIREEIDKNRLHDKLMRLLPEESQIYHLILISGYLLEMGIAFQEFINIQTFERWFKRNSNFDFRAIYFLHKLSERLNYSLSEQQKTVLNKHMKVAILKLEVNYFQNNYLVFLLQYYPEYVNMLNILHFTPRAYLGYLLFYKQNPGTKIMSHKIPHSVIELANVYTFRTILEYRMTLSLDNALSLAKTLPDFFAHSLKAVNSYISYLRENKIDDLQVQFYVQKAVQSKLKLNQDFTIEIIETFSLNEIITLFAHLSNYRMCSVNFWKKAVRLLEKIIEMNKQTKIIQTRSENYVNLLSIAASKNFKEETRETIYTELISLLNNSNNEWTMRSLVKITRILAFNKIGEDEIWLLIERRILKYLSTQKQPRENIGEALKDNLVRVILGFNSLEKGSYKFWHEMNEILDSKSKKEVLTRIKSINTLAHANLKITS